MWDALLAQPRSPGTALFGVGLTDKSYGGLPIDSSWLAAYQELGLVGVGIIVATLLTIVVTAVVRPPSLERSCAIFLVVYCMIASYTRRVSTLPRHTFFTSLLRHLCWSHL